MGPLDALWHLLNFVLPAVLLGTLSATGAKLIWRRQLAARRWRRLASDTSLASFATLVGGLVISDHDGRMATYAAMVAAAALTLWWRGFLAPR